MHFYMVLINQVVMRCHVHRSVAVCHSPMLSNLISNAYWASFLPSAGGWKYASLYAQTETFVLAELAFRPSPLNIAGFNQTAKGWDIWVAVNSTYIENVTITAKIVHDITRNLQFMGEQTGHWSQDYVKPSSWIRDIFVNFNPFCHFSMWYECTQEVQGECAKLVWLWSHGEAWSSTAQDHCHQQQIGRRRYASEILKLLMHLCLTLWWLMGH